MAYSNFIIFKDLIIIKDLGQYHQSIIIEYIWLKHIYTIYLLFHVTQYKSFLIMSNYKLYKNC